MTDRIAACGEEGMVVPYQELGSFCCCLFRIILAASTVVVETQVLPQLRIVALRKNRFFLLFFEEQRFLAWLESYQVLTSSIGELPGSTGWGFPPC